jgi:hypothetical protein
MNENEVGLACSMKDGQERYIGALDWENLSERRAFGRSCLNWEDNEERILKKCNVRAQTVLSWLRTGKISVCFYHGN